MQYYELTLQVQLAQFFDECSYDEDDDCPDEYGSFSYRHDSVELPKPHISPGHLGQHSPGNSGNGFWQVIGGHSSFQQSNSPYFND